MSLTSAGAASSKPIRPGACGAPAANTISAIPVLPWRFEGWSADPGVSIRSPAIPAVAAFHGSQAEVLPQGAAYVLGPEQATALQFGNDHLDEVLAAAGQGGRRDVEAIAA